jgi:hypothetical protein
LAPLRRRIEIWRSTRPSRGETPTDIWDSAVALARIYGVCQIARAVGLDYKALRTQVAKAPEKPGLVKPTFVELPATLAAEQVPALLPGTSIEITSPGGSRMRITLEAGRGMEAAGIVAAFLGSRG